MTIEDIKTIIQGDETRTLEVKKTTGVLFKTTFLENWGSGVGRMVEGSTVFTDELNAYNALGSMGYNHKVCDHGQLQFVVDGEIYTNNIEGFWSHFRRMITGCYHDVSDEHLQSYIDEAVYRWNTRKASQSERFSDMFNKSIGLIVTWNELKLCKVA